MIKQLLDITKTTAVHPVLLKFIHACTLELYGRRTIAERKADMDVNYTSLAVYCLGWTTCGFWGHRGMARFTACVPPASFVP